MMSTRSFLSLPATLLAGALALGGLAACGGDDPVDTAASHMCACEKLREGLADVAACEAEVATAIKSAPSGDCAECINDNAGSSTTLQTCEAIDAACADQCGFFDSPAAGITQAATGMCACDALVDPSVDLAACQTDYEALLGTKTAACVDCVNTTLAPGVDATTCDAMNTDCAASCQ